MNPLEFRFAEINDIDAIVELYNIALQPLSSKAEREYIREKIRLHILGPGSGALTAWYGRQLIGFLLYVKDEDVFARYIKSLPILLRVLIRLICGFYGFNLFAIYQLFQQWRTKAERRLSENASEPRLKLPSSYLTAYATHPKWRGQGIGSRLVQIFLDELKREGRKEVYTWVLVSNQPSLHLLVNKFGFEKRGVVRRFGEDNYLLVKKL